MITSENTHQNQDIHLLRTEMATKVSWIIFIAFTTVIITVIGWVIASNNNNAGKIENVSKEVSDTKGDVKSINANIANIKEGMKEIKELINLKIK